MKQEKGSPMGLYTIGIAALFLAGFFLLVVFGAQSYRNTVAGQNDNMHRRALLSWLTTTVKAYDASGAVRMMDDPDVGQVLVLLDGDSGYALRIYRADGVLVEDYAGADAALRPDDAQAIGETSLFLAERVDGGIMKLTTDEGSVMLHLRSAEVAE